MEGAQIIGRVGTVTGTVSPDHLGEMMLHIRGGIEAYYAEPYDGRETIAIGAECVIVDYSPSRPRTVQVSAMPPVG